MYILRHQYPSDFVSVSFVFGEYIPIAEFGMISAETACWDIERK
jgi:hypothetical protein